MYDHSTPTPQSVIVLLPEAIALVQKVKGQSFNEQELRIQMRAKMREAKFGGAELHYLYNLTRDPEMDAASNVAYMYSEAYAPFEEFGAILGAVYLMVNAASDAVNELILGLTDVPLVLSQDVKSVKMTPPANLERDS